jgi:hypothetical protein
MKLSLLGCLHALIKAAPDSEGILDSAFEGVTDRPEDHIGIGAHGLAESATAATTTADHSDFNLVWRVLRLDDSGKRGCEACGGAGFQDSSSILVHDFLKCWFIV